MHMHYKKKIASSFPYFPFPLSSLPSFVSVPPLLLLRRQAPSWQGHVTGPIATPLAVAVFVTALYCSEV